MTSRSLTRPSRVAGWAASVVLGLLLAGLVAMHGLGMHGTMSGHDQMASPGHAVTESVAVTTVESHPAMASCLTVLTGGLLLLLGLAGSGRTPTATARGGCTELPSPRGRDPDPPDLTLLSVRRC